MKVFVTLHAIFADQSLLNGGLGQESAAVELVLLLDSLEENVSYT
jgi:hypothetical protein